MYMREIWQSTSIIIVEQDSLSLEFGVEYSVSALSAAIIIQTY